MKIIQLTVPTNWESSLIEQLAEFPVTDVYGCLDKTPIGGGRPSAILPKVSEEFVAEHIKLVHQKKMKFSYVLNAPCMGNLEYDHDYHKQLLAHIQWISDIEADGVIVTSPFLISLIKTQFPKLNIRVSTIAHVNSVNRAKYYEQLGASEITPDVMINRDFQTLEKMQQAVKCKLILLVTDGCLYQCPFRHYHYNMMGHASQLDSRYHVDFPILNCSIIKFSNPTEVIKSRWIRPEDLPHYEAIGIKNFKLGGRRLPAEWILRAVNAYTSKKYEGNLIDIIEGFSFSYGSIQKKEASERFGESVDQEWETQLIIDNRKLDGFIDFFKTQNCLAMCDECKYCEEWAQKAVTLNKEQANDYIQNLQNFIDDLITSREFGIKTGAPQKKKKKGVTWNPETLRIFEEMVQTAPQEFQSMTKMVIGSLAEGKAKKRGATTVENEDMVSAFIEGTPGPFQATMRKDLEKYGFKIET